MAKTNHIFTIKPIYCRRLHQELAFVQKHFDTQCMTKCPFFVGVFQGNGIECLFDDGSNEAIEMIFEESQTQMVADRTAKFLKKELYRE